MVLTELKELPRRPTKEWSSICTGIEPILTTKGESTLSDHVNLTIVKQWAAENLGHQSALREILLQEKTEIPIAEFLLKMRIWLALARRKEDW